LKQSAHNSSAPQAKFTQHTAAVKAIAWSPHQRGLLASGGGITDGCIKFWNTLSFQNQSSVETGSQICNLMFSKNVNELVSTHGYSQNQINIWK
jgi:cell division cycle 20-like protein 1 (cofactor of APC complex)